MKPLYVPQVGDAWHEALMAGRRAEGWGVAQKCAECGRTSYTGVRCTACTFACEVFGRDAGSGKGYDFPMPYAPAEEVERPEVVAPEVVCPEHCGHVAPGPVLDLRKLAVEKGWRAAIQHSRGGVMGGNGKQLGVADMWGVRFRRGPWMGYAVRRGAAWGSVCVAGTDLPPFLRLGVTGLREWLAEPARPPSWYGEVVAKEAAAALAAKVVPCPGVAGCRWDDPQSLRHTHRGNGDVKQRKARKQAEHGG